MEYFEFEPIPGAKPLEQIFEELALRRILEKDDSEFAEKDRPTKSFNQLWRELLQRWQHSPPRTSDTV